MHKKPDGTIKGLDNIRKAWRAARHFGPVYESVKHLPDAIDRRHQQKPWDGIERRNGKDRRDLVTVK